MIKLIFSNDQSAYLGRFTQLPTYAHYTSISETVNQGSKKQVVFKSENIAFLKAELKKHLLAAGLIYKKDFNVKNDSKTRKVIRQERLR